MNRKEFISALERELRKLPAEEREAAVEYFEEYFDEVLAAGNRTEEEICKELGNPKRIAAEIKADYAARILEDDEKIGETRASRGQRVSAVWWVLLGICAAPVSIVLATVLFVLLICLIVVVAAIYIAIAAVGVGAIACVVFGLVALFSSISTGLMFIGFGVVLIAIFLGVGAAMIMGTKKLFRFIKRKAGERREKNKSKKLERMYAEGRYENFKKGGVDYEE